REAYRFLQGQGHLRQEEGSQGPSLQLLLNARQVPTCEKADRAAIRSAFCIETGREPPATMSISMWSMSA
ncbi:MAG: hypothetical protein RSD93_06735, partial [Gordonibacter sp.]|uniref:hypothetical protein n=1 Tax=Gordonibacter sp. TaxID=1968902 RepID=UPI002FCA43D1